LTVEDLAQALSPAGINPVNLDADIAAESTLLPGEQTAIQRIVS
jgi:hypothetical protein